MQYKIKLDRQTGFEYVVGLNNSTIVKLTPENAITLRRITEAGQTVAQVLKDAYPPKEAQKVAPRPSSLRDALIDLLGDQPDVQEGICRYCGRDWHDKKYPRDEIIAGGCPYEDCPGYRAHLALDQQDEAITHANSEIFKAMIELARNLEAKKR